MNTDPNWQSPDDVPVERNNDGTISVGDVHWVEGGVGDWHVFEDVGVPMLLDLYPTELAAIKAAQRREYQKYLGWKMRGAQDD